MRGGGKEQIGGIVFIGFVSALLQFAALGLICERHGDGDYRRRAQNLTLPEKS